MIIVNYLKTQKRTTNQPTQLSLKDLYKQVLKETPSLFVNRSFKLYQTKVGDKPLPLAIKIIFENKFIDTKYKNKVFVSTILEKTLISGKKFYDIAIYFGDTPSLITTEQMFRLRMIGEVKRTNITIEECKVTFNIREPWINGIDLLNDSVEANKTDETDER